MAFARRDFVKETSTVTGTGAITLAGARVPAQTFAAVCSNGDTFRYAISNQSGPNEWEVGLGTYNSGANTITRSPVASSNGGGLVNFSVGTKFVDIVVDTAQFDAFLTAGGGGGDIDLVSHVGGLSVADVTRLAFSNASNVSFSMSTAASAMTVRAFAAAFSQLEIGAFGTSFTTLTASTITGNGFVNIRFPEMATSLDSLFSYPNVLWRFQTGAVQHSARQVAFQRYLGSGIAAGVSAQMVSFSNANNLTFGIASTTIVDSGVVAIYTAIASGVGGGGGIQSVVLNSTLNRSQFSLYTDATVTGTLVEFYQNSINTVNLQQINVNFRASGNTLVAAAHVFAFGSDSADNASVQGIQLLNSNGVTFSLTRVANAVFGRIGQFTASVDPRIGLVSHVGGNVASSVTQLAFSNASNVVWSLSTAASAVTVIASVAAAPTHTLAVSAAGASVSNGTVVWSNSNNVSFGQAGSTITATATVAATRDIGVVSHIGGDVVSSVSQLAFSNASNVTFSLSTAANAATVIASVAAAGGLTYSGFRPNFAAAVIVTQSLTNGSLWVQPLNDAPAFQFDRIVQLMGLSNATNATNSNTLNYFLGLYTRNASTLSRVASASFSTAFTGSGTVGNYSLFSGPRHLTMGMTTTVSASDYWIACGAILSTAGNSSFSVSFGMLSQSLSNQVHGLGLASAATYQSMLGKGFYTATSNAAPASIAFSQVNGTNSVAYRFPALYFGSGTA